MSFLLLGLASLLAILPAAVALFSGSAVPPQQGVLFAVTEVTLSAIVAGLVLQNRDNICLQPARQLTHRVIIAGALAGILLVAYLFAYNHCVIEHPLYKDKLLFPLWTSGKLAGMVQKAGSRYGAVETYGLAAVFDAISEMPGSAYATALGTLLVLYASPLSIVSAIAVVLSIRYEGHLGSIAYRPESHDVPGRRLMTPEHEDLIRQCFGEALQLGEAERAVLLAQRCGSDEELRKEVESLLEQSCTGATSILDLRLRRDLGSALSSALQEYRTEGSAVSLCLKGRYRLKRELGRGGFGVVYLASDERLLPKQVVVKLMLDPLPDQWHRKKFRNEVEALARLNHPGIVSVLDTGETEDGRQFLVMEYVEGVSLRSLIKPEGMDFGRIADISRQVGRALETAHRKGIWHRDLKPENIIVQTLEDGEQQVKLIDFGIATVEGSAPASTTRVAGTPGYMAPEQLSGKPNAASDIYSLGVNVYEMVTGRTPFKAETPVQLLAMQLAGTPIHAKILRPILSDEAGKVILKAIQHDERDRYRTVTAFVQEFLNALRDSISLLRPAEPSNESEPQRRTGRVDR